MTSLIVHTTMNYMKKQTQKHLAALSSAVGDFIRYWGFRRIHGEIWTQVYLSAEPLSGVELTQRLGVSKALVSPALKELIGYRLILEKPEDGKTKRYLANPDVIGVILEILREREVRLIARIEKAHRQLSDANPESVDLDKLLQLGSLIEMGKNTTQFIFHQIEEPITNGTTT